VRLAAALGRFAHGAIIQDDRRPSEIDKHCAEDEHLESDMEFGREHAIVRTV
jgi:hypothetical protein